MEGITRHYDKIILTLIMCLVILFMATFSPFAESANAVTEVVAAGLVAIVIAALAALGITFVSSGTFTTTSDYVNDLMNQYATSMNTTVSAQTKGIQTGTNKLGQILVNNRFLVYISGFIAFLKATLDIGNNETMTLITTGASFGDITLYELPFMWTFDNGAAWTLYQIVTGTGYVVNQYENENNRMPVIVTTDPNTTVRATAVYPNGYVFDRTSDVNAQLLNTTTGEILYYVAPVGAVDIRHSLDYPLAYSYTNQQWSSAWQESGSIDYNNTGLDVITGIINPPLDDTNYTDGDGAIIDVDANWGATYDDVTDDVIPDEFSDSKEGEASIEYVSEEEVTEAVEDSSEITNLPAGTIPFSPMQLPQFHLVDIWHYVADWIDDTAIAAGALMAIVVQEPHPMVNLFYATVCLAIIFGLIKGLAK